MRILIIDNNMLPAYHGANDIRAFSYLAPGATFFTRRAPSDDLPADTKMFDRVIVSGSFHSILVDTSWSLKLEEWVRRFISENKPVMGICYGHQLLGKIIGGKSFVGKANPPELGWAKLILKKEKSEGKNQVSPFIKNIPDTFYSFSSHFDEIQKPPKNCRVLISSKDCAVQAFDVPGKPIFGIQFHPEKPFIETEKTLNDWKKDKNLRGYLLNTKGGKKLYNPKIGETLFKNFLSI